MLRRGPGQPPSQPAPEQRKLVQILRAIGTPQAIIARNVGPHGIDEKTLHKHFAEELATGHAQVVVSTGVVLVRAGLAGNVSAGLIG